MCCTMYNNKQVACLQHLTTYMYLPSRQARDSCMKGIGCRVVSSLSNDPLSRETIIIIIIVNDQQGLQL